MKFHVQARTTSALSRTDVLVVVATVALLAIVLMTPMGQTLLKSRRVTCVENLKIIGLSFRLADGGSTERLPWQYPIADGGVMDESLTNLPWRAFQVCSNELSMTRVLVCPQDSRRPPAKDWNIRNQNISYFVGLSANDSAHETILSGDRNLENSRALLAPGQHDLARLPALDFGPQMHKRSGYVGLADGSVRLLTKASLAAAVSTAATNKTRSLRLQRVAERQGLPDKTNVFVVVP